MEKICKFTFILSFFFVLVGAQQFICPSTLEARTIEEGAARLQAIHSKLHLIHGSFTDEYPDN